MYLSRSINISMTDPLMGWLKGMSSGKARAYGMVRVNEVGGKSKSQRDDFMYHRVW